MHRVLTGVGAVLVLASGALVGASETPRQWRFTGAERIVAIGDVHGAYSPLVGLLEKCDLVSSEGRWIGGQTHLVMLGDFVDRGPRSREVLDLVMRLQDEARDAGGRVHVVLGNHEVMNLVGDLRYVSAEEFAAFADDENPKERSRYVKKRIGQSMSQNGSAKKLRPILSAEYPPGYFAHRRAFSPQGKYGSWLLDQQILVVVNDVAFVHGGLPSSLLGIEPDAINTAAMDEIRQFIDGQQQLLDLGLIGLEMSYKRQIRGLRGIAAGQYRTKKTINLAGAMLEASKGLAFVRGGPVRYRGTSLNPAEDEMSIVAEVLAHLGAQRVVVGHTPTHTGRISTRFDGAVIRADTGMLTSHYGGRASALMVQDDRLYSFYPVEGIAPLSTRRWELTAGTFAGVADVEAFLATAPILGIEELGTGSTKPMRVTLGDERRSGQAIFKDVEREVPCLVEGRATSCRDSYAHEIAAYRVDRMIGLDMVPPTVVRVIDGKMGSLQLWVEGAINENNRRDEDLSPPDPEDFASQLERAELFDRLISNPDRNGSGILITTDDWGVHLIDHSTAFTPSVSQAQADGAWKTRSNGEFAEDLAGVDLTVLRNRLRPLLSDAELEALLARVESAIRAYSEAGGR